MSFEEDMKHHREVHTKLLEQALEDVRVERWHATYNAALTGYCARQQSMQLQGPPDIHEHAVIAANLAHGRLGT